MNLPVKAKHILILTGEPSGDYHAARLAFHLKQLDPNLYISGIGGQYMENQGVDLFFHIEKLSAMGVTEIILQFNQIKKAFNLFKQKLSVHRPDLIVMIDYPGFNLKAAQYAKAQYPIKILYYITPKVWAWKKSRLKKIRQYVDHAALIFPFEEKLFKKSQIPCTYVGNPLLDDYPEHITKPFLKNKNNNVNKGLTIGLLPGSRKNEVKTLLNIMHKACILINQHYPKVKFVVSKAVSIHESYLKKFLRTDQINYKIHRGKAKQLLLESDIVIAASGTVTLEAALCCVPTVIVYRMSYISYKIARLLVQIKYAGLANIIANREVMPEMLQDQADPEKIANKIVSMVKNLELYENNLVQVRQKLGQPGAARRVAGIALSMTRT